MEKNLVPGDIVQVKAGEKVPADLRILTATDLKVNNASLTGENVDIKLGSEPKNDRLYEARNIARSGCNFTCGNGVAVVFATGDQTFLGSISKATTQTKRQDTLMQREIHRMITILSILAVILGVAFGFISFFVAKYTWIQAVALAIGIIVANVPEGLVSQLVVTLTVTAKKLQKEKVIVSNLEIIETLGAITVICSDKTGTLTENRMTVSHVVYGGRIFSSENAVDPPGDAFDPVDFDDPEMKSLMHTLYCNTDAVFASREGPDVLKWETKGDASESALIKFAQPLHDVVEYRQRNKRVTSIPFNSTNKWMLSVNRNEDPLKVHEVYVKGAPERILNMCATARISGKEAEFTPEVREHFEDLNRRLARKGERVLAFASLELPADQFPEGYAFDPDCEPRPNFPTDGLCLQGFISLVDPPRAAVPPSVQECYKAGIKVFMVTGDHPETALAISRNIGIVTQPTWKELEESGKTGGETQDTYRGAIAVHGTEMESFTEDDWEYTLTHDEIVFARTMPQQKQEIVFQLNKRGHIVAMTGDGVNDAPALKAANVGVAMGSGASVAKEAGQIILMDDNFASILEGIRAGRLVFGTMKKVIQYVLVSNVPEIVPFLLTVAFGVPLAIETIVILLIDLGTDILPAIALGYEEEEGETMSKPPRGPHEHLVSAKIIIWAYITYGLFHTFAAYFGFFFVWRDRGFTWTNLWKDRMENVRKDVEDMSQDKKDLYVRICQQPETFTTYQEYFPGGNCEGDFLEYLDQTLGNAQAAFFFAIVWGQIAQVFLRKTFSESIFSKRRLFKNKFLLFTILFELVLGFFVVYVPGLNGVFLLVGPGLSGYSGIKGKTSDARYIYTTMWYMPLLIMIDETAKFFIRRNPKGCVAWCYSIW